MLLTGLISQVDKLVVGRFFCGSSRNLPTSPAAVLYRWTNNRTPHHKRCTTGMPLSSIQRDTEILRTDRVSHYRENVPLGFCSRFRRRDHAVDARADMDRRGPFIQWSALPLPFLDHPFTTEWCS
jgi:hypothetical protein